MSIESLPEHIRMPHLRPFQPLPVQKDGKQFVALRDPAMLTQQTMVVPPQVLGILQHFRGERTIDQIAAEIGGQVNQFADLAKALDQVGLLWGPTFERMESEVKEKVRAAGAFPAFASASMGTDAAACRAAIEGYFAETEDPEIEGTIVGVVAPHLDYQRGWPNYAAAYHGLRNTTAPDRIVILGTNHFGIGDGVIMSEFGFDSPMGRCPADSTVVSAMVEKLGRPLIVDQLDHLPEHSIQLHLPWLQYCFGNVPVVGVLVPDPLTPMIEDDGERVSFEHFVTTMNDVLDQVGGRTLFVASSDLSHVGPQFGEPRPVDEQRRMDVEQHDREMMAKYLSADAEEFLAAMRWNKNPTRWCSIGNMAAALMLAKPEAVELIDYRQAYDDAGNVLVSSAAMVMV
ncbi:MAG TPA: AmmeMemoRadiSam system protein B [Phycisphaerales bacterium]|nr:AmmeMemoRadiSam system protein B [Phycisphaerales bacterium]HRQ75384.1 AmmeMemoRadiSam system protein B [Phycisphaerales bacterium]